MGSRWSTVRSLVLPQISHHGRLLRIWLLSFFHAGSEYGFGLPSFQRFIAAERWVWQRLPTFVSAPQSRHGLWKVTPSGSQAAEWSEQ